MVDRDMIMNIIDIKALAELFDPILVCVCPHTRKKGKCKEKKDIDIIIVYDNTKEIPSIPKCNELLNKFCRASNNRILDPRWISIKALSWLLENSSIFREVFEKCRIIYVKEGVRL